MRPIGGEIELQASCYDEYFTDSGRSSLRLFFKQNKFKDKKILIPDFLCDIIVDVLQQERVEYSFYKIDEEFRITEASVNNQDYDILYVIHYFGNITTVDVDISHKILIEDYVFHYSFQNRLKHRKWFAFNSFRKISPVYDGSHIKTNLTIDNQYIVNSIASFVDFKKTGKDIKFEYIKLDKGKEEDYLNKLLLGENILDNQRTIHTISNASLSYLLSYNSNQNLREERFCIAQKQFNNSLNLTPSYYSFFIIKSNNRDQIRKELMKKGIYLPIHWNGCHSKNDLSKQLLSIPLSENYNKNEFSHMIKTIKKLFMI